MVFSRISYDLNLISRWLSKEIPIYVYMQNVNSVCFGIIFPKMSFSSYLHDQGHSWSPIGLRQALGLKLKVSFLE